MAKLKYRRIIDDVRKYHQEYASLSYDELKVKVGDLKRAILQNDVESKKFSILDYAGEAFGILSVMSESVLGLVPYDVQIEGACVLVSGAIAEMKTGEGKTLTAAFAAFLRALVGKGVHVATTNDYLAERDRDMLASLLEPLGMTVGRVYSSQLKSDKQVAYRSDVTYGTANEFGFDYLRDNMVVYENLQVHRGFYYVIVDEADSILIDESRTPLIIASPDSHPSDFYKTVDHAVKTLKRGDYILDLKTKSVELSDSGVSKLCKIFGVSELYTFENRELVHFIMTALKANVMMFKDVDYIVEDGKVEIVDLFTGRVLNGRRFSDGLHQALEAKEDVEIQQETYTSATVSLQNYFRLYDILSGMTGTAWTERKELKDIYKIDTYRIPTNRPVIRKDEPDVLYATMKGKLEAIIKDVVHHQKLGQPVLVGTASVEMSEILSGILTKIGIEHALLNAKLHRKEAEIIAMAGQKGSVTIATNMAGRGTDILLGEGVRELGGLYVIGTERHESRRIDNQLRGRSGRQGDPGKSKFYVSLEDDLIVRFGNDHVKNIVKQYKQAGSYDVHIQSRLVRMQVDQAQLRVEGNNYDSRKQLLDYDEVLNVHRQLIYRDRLSVIQQDVDIHQTVIDMMNEFLKYAVYEYNEDEMISFAKVIFYENIQPVVDALARYKNKPALLDYLRQLFLKTYNLRRVDVDSQRLTMFELNILLKTIDYYWAKHIVDMSELRSVVGLRAYAQTDPLNEYKREAFGLYNRMKTAIQYDVLCYCMNEPIMDNLERVQENV